MRKKSFIGLLLAQLAGMAADNNAELLCVWNYRTHYESPAVNGTPARVVYTEGTSYFFFTDNTYVKAGISQGYDEVMQLKPAASRWMTVDNNLVLFGPDGKQTMSIVAKVNSPVDDLLKGEKDIHWTVPIHSGTVPHVYAETIAFFPQQ